MEKDQVISERYRLLEKLGEGGMGSVWLAHHVQLGTPLALKLINPETARHPEALARFKQEAQAAASLRTRHVVQVVDFGVDQGLPFIAMELLQGEDLATRLEREKRLSPEALLSVLTQVAQGISRAHEQGIVHRDLKPANIFITRDEDTGDELVKVLDFGIAKTLYPLDGEVPLQTQTGQVLGTPLYMSPEQILRQGALDGRVDVWATAVIAFEALTGSPPFQGETAGQLALAICAEALPIPSLFAPVPRDFDAWFACAAHRDPEGRFRTMEAAIAALITACNSPVVGDFSSRQPGSSTLPLSPHIDHQPQRPPAEPANLPAEPQQPAPASHRLPEEEGLAPLPAPAQSVPSSAPGFSATHSVDPIASRPNQPPDPRWVAGAAVVGLLLVLGLGGFYAVVQELVRWGGSAHQDAESGRPAEGSLAARVRAAVSGQIAPLAAPSASSSAPLGPNDDEPKEERGRGEPDVSLPSSSASSSTKRVGASHPVDTSRVRPKPPPRRTQQSREDELRRRLGL